MVAGGKEKEIKVKKRPGRVPTACAECRRLKLKCDKNVPCEKCVTRGCGSICPDGSLTPGKGNRLILANTEELHDRIEQLSARNRELESALRALQETVSDQPHPLLSVELLQPPAPVSTTPNPAAKPPTHPSQATTKAIWFEEAGSTHDSFGTLIAKHWDDYAYIGRSARPELHCRLQGRTTDMLSRMPERMLPIAYPEFRVIDPMVVSQLFRLLPPLSEALHLCDIYYEHAKYTYVPLTWDELQGDILDVLYVPKLANPNQHLHTLSLLFAIFAIASVFDTGKESYAYTAHQFYQLSRTSYNLISGTTLHAVLSLVHSAAYLELCQPAFSKEEELGSSWSLISTAVQIAYSIGLHTPNDLWNLTPTEAQRRRRCFSRLVLLDVWTSFYIGRPPILAETYMDSNTELGEGLNNEHQNGAEYHFWNLKLAAYAHSVVKTFGPQAMSYTSILELDRSIRNFVIPQDWRIPESEPQRSTVPLETRVYRFQALANKEILLLNLHRPYFMQAIQESSTDLMRHRYLPSVISVYRSAWRLIQALVNTWVAEPKFLSRISLPWSHGFSASIVLGLLIVKASGLHITPVVLEELDKATSLFGTASSACATAATHLRTISRIHRKAHDVAGTSFYRYKQQDDHPLSTDELERLGGKTSFLSQSGGSTSDHSTFRKSKVDSSGSQTSSAFPTAHLHPTLAHDLVEFTNRGVKFTSTIALYDEASGQNMDEAKPSSTQYSVGIPAPFEQPHARNSLEEPRLLGITPPVLPSLLSDPAAIQRPMSGPEPPDVVMRPPPRPSIHQQETYVPAAPVNDYEEGSVQIRRTSSILSGGFGGWTGNPAGGMVNSQPIALDPSWNPFLEQLGF